MSETDKVPPDTLDLFEAAVEHVNAHSYSTKDKLVLYGLYKHVTAGRCNIKRPARFKVSAYNKYEAWKSCSQLTVGHAMNKYIKHLSDIDKSFKPNEMTRRSTPESRAVRELDELPPVAPPAFHGKNQRSKSKVPNISVLPGTEQIFDSEDGSMDNVAESDLHDRLVRFYREVDKQRLAQGIGEIVQFGLSNGISTLKQKLKKKYNVDLTDVEAKDVENRQKMKEHLSHRAAPIDVTVMKNLDHSIIPELTLKLDNFFMKYDPETAVKGKSSGYMDYVKYADDKGIQALNKKLRKKYGRDLTVVAELAEQPPMSSNFFSESEWGSKRDLPTLKSRKMSKDFSIIAKSSAVSGVTKLTRKDSKASGVIILGIERDEHSDDGSPTNKIELPKYVKEALRTYYTKYDSQCLTNGSYQNVYKWASRNGLRNLNRELNKRYGQSLDSFIDDLNQLGEELMEFYKVMDPPKLQGKIKTIFKWGIKHGRRALNLKLLQKYGKDLVTYNLRDFRKLSNTSIEF